MARSLVGAVMAFLQADSRRFIDGKIPPIMEICIQLSRRCKNHWDLLLHISDINCNLQQQQKPSNLVFCYHFYFLANLQYFTHLLIFIWLKLNWKTIETTLVSVYRTPNQHKQTFSVYSQFLTHKVLSNPVLFFQSLGRYFYNIPFMLEIII